MSKPKTRPRGKRAGRWSDLFLWEINRRGEVPMFRQIYLQMRSAILQQRVRPGTRLPSTRELARRLGLSRTAVVSGYEQLLAEGYLTGKVGSGTYVSTELPEPLEFGKAKRALSRKPAAIPHPAALTVRAQVASAFVRSWPVADAVPFARGVCHVDERSREAWRKLSQRMLRSFDATHRHYSDPRGLPELRREICDYLRSARAVRCDPGQIVITGGTQHAIDILLRMLVQPGDEAWIEDPHYSLTYHALRAAQATVRPAPVDGQGFDVRAGARGSVRTERDQARLVFVTPSHQHPLGVSMSMARRLELLTWSRETGAWILEDDCDGEFRYAGRPLAALQGLEDAGDERVIYVGTFNKVLFPGLRMGYAVLPKTLVDGFLGIRFLTERHPPSFEQKVLTEFMAQGEFTAHIRRTRIVYREARDQLVSELKRQAGAWLSVEAPDQGMHLVAYLDDRISDVEVEAAARREGLVARALSPLYLKAPARGGLVLGYTGFPQRAIAPAVTRLAQVFRAASRGRRRTG